MKVENNTQQKIISLILSKESCYVSGKKKQENRGEASKPFKDNSRKKKPNISLCCRPKDAVGKAFALHA